MRLRDLSDEFFKDNTGQLSMMRLAVYTGIQLARVIVTSGLIILPLELFVFKTGTTTGLVLVGIGTAMFGMGEGFKALQAKSENTLSNLTEGK